MRPLLTAGEPQNASFSVVTLFTANCRTSLPSRNTNTFSPTMIGLDAPGPGSAVFQARLVSVDQTLGKDSESLAMPEPAGPRKRGQSSASKLVVARTNETKQKIKNAHHPRAAQLRRIGSGSSTGLSRTNSHSISVLRTRGCNSVSVFEVTPPVQFGGSLCPSSRRPMCY